MGAENLLESVRPLLEVFQELNLSYYIGGSVGSSAHGMARTTVDVDMVLNLKAEHIAELVHKLEEKYYIDAHMMREALRRNTCFNLIHLTSMLKVDIFPLGSSPFEKEAFKRRRKQKLFPKESLEIYIATAEDLVLQKLDWYRKGNEVSERQMNDVLGILQVQSNRLDKDYMKKWAKALHIEDLLQLALNFAKAK